MKMPRLLTSKMVGLLLCIALSSCTLFSEKSTPLFESIPAGHTNITFENTIKSDPDFNVYKYRNFYNGGGTAIGDFNGDGLPDIYLTSNQKPNRLYINKGNFTFDDVTEVVGVSGTKPWATGVSVADVNADGFLDLYICNSGEFSVDERRNELFINNGDGTFTESAKQFGLDNAGYSIQSSFFDYDADGDLDMYLLNNSDASVIGFDLSKNQRIKKSEYGGDKLFRNDGGFFTDVTDEAGIYSSEAGFGLSATVSDLNGDGYSDLYVANDFFEHDYLYLNQGDGSFQDVLKNQINSTSAAAMGADIADINNDGLPDIYVADMLPETDQRAKQITTYEDWELFSEKINYGYHPQLTRNTLQLNNGDGTYSEIGRLAGVEASDWSWAVLMADYDLNGYNDILVTNGLIQDITDLDYIREINGPGMVRSIVTDDNVDFMRLVDMIPSTPIPNVVFANNGDLKFENKSEAWGLDDPGYSSGAAWADFDQDGDLDLVINDINGPAKIYKNRAAETYPERGSVVLKLTGDTPNTQAIGAMVEMWADSSYWFREHNLQRGYQGSVEPGIFIGSGNHQTMDSLKVTWPDKKITQLYDLKTPFRKTLRQSEAIPVPSQSKDDQSDAVAIKNTHLLTDITNQINLGWAHQKNDYNDFKREHLLLQMRSTEGPALCKGDVNNDGLEDFYIGGARNQTGLLAFQTNTGGFKKMIMKALEADSASEDTDCVFFDANGDSFQDLFITSGGNSYSTGASALFDRLYINDGNGNLRKDPSLKPPGGFSSNSTVSSGDFNGDGATDLFIGERLQPFALGVPVSGYILINDGQGNFTDQSTSWSSEFKELGMITDSAVTDWNGDRRDDLIVVGEWMTPRIFINTGSSFDEVTDKIGLSDAHGLWNTVYATDFDGDGRKDLVLGNHGLNSFLKTSEENPLKMWIADLENDGVAEQIITRSFNGQDYPFVLKHDLLGVLPSLTHKYPMYSDYADQTMQDIFSKEKLEKSIVLQADILESILILNKENGTELLSLPDRSQFSPVFGIWSGDLTGDGNEELITLGNLLEVKPMAGPYDASYGTVISSDLKSIPAAVSGFSVRGSGRKMISVKIEKGDEILIVTRNNAAPLFYQIHSL